MAIRTYQLYSAAAAAQGLASTPVVAKGDVLAISFALLVAANQGVTYEISNNITRQVATNGAQGILGAASISSAAITTHNVMLPIPAGCTVKPGDTFYLHGTQIGSGGTGTCDAIIYVREA